MASEPCIVRIRLARRRVGLDERALVELIFPTSYAISAISVRISGVISKGGSCAMVVTALC